MELKLTLESDGKKTSLPYDPRERSPPSNQNKKKYNGEEGVTRVC